MNENVVAMLVMVGGSIVYLIGFGIIKARLGDRYADRHRRREQSVFFQGRSDPPWYIFTWLWPIAWIGVLVWIVARRLIRLGATLGTQKPTLPKARAKVIDE